MAYTKTVWVASTAPGVSAANLNNLETQFDQCMVFNPTSGTLALLASPNFSGTPTAPTAARTVNSTQIATCAYVHNFYITSVDSTVMLITDLSTYTGNSSNETTKKTYRVPPKYVPGAVFRIYFSACIKDNGDHGDVTLFSDLDNVGSIDWSNSLYTAHITSTTYGEYSYAYTLRVPCEAIYFRVTAASAAHPIYIKNCGIAGVDSSTLTSWV